MSLRVVAYANTRSTQKISESDPGLSPAGREVGGPQAAGEKTFRPSGRSWVVPHTGGKQRLLAIKRAVRAESEVPVGDSGDLQAFNRHNCPPRGQSENRF